MTGSAKSGIHATPVPDYASLHPGYSGYVREGQLPEDWAGDVSEKEADFGEPAGGGSLP